jgi:hypothetical protein
VFLQLTKINTVQTEVFITSLAEITWAIALETLILSNSVLVQHATNPQRTGAAVHHGANYQPGTPEVADKRMLTHQGAPN